MKKFLDDTFSSLSFLISHFRSASSGANGLLTTCDERYGYFVHMYFTYEKAGFSFFKPSTRIRYFPVSFPCQLHFSFYSNLPFSCTTLSFRFVFLSLFLLPLTRCSRGMPSPTSTRPKPRPRKCDRSRLWPHWKRTRSRTWIWKRRTKLNKRCERHGENRPKQW